MTSAEQLPYCIVAILLAILYCCCNMLCSVALCCSFYFFLPCFVIRFSESVENVDVEEAKR